MRLPVAYNRPYRNVLLRVNPGDERFSAPNPEIEHEISAGSATVALYPR